MSRLAVAAEDAVALCPPYRTASAVVIRVMFPLVWTIVTVVDGVIVSVEEDTEVTVVPLNWVVVLLETTVLVSVAVFVITAE